MRVRGLQLALQAGLIAGDFIHIRLNVLSKRGLGGWVGMGVRGGRVGVVGGGGGSGVAD